VRHAGVPFVVRGGSPDPAHAHDSDQSGEAAEMIVVVVRQHHAIERAHALPCERSPDACSVRPGVHQHGSHALPDKDRVTLSTVHDDHLPGRRPGRPDCDQDAERDDGSQQHPGTARTTGRWPPHPYKHRHYARADHEPEAQ
jgi:hypothetical protein